jgi:pyrophosphatase PpaX
VTPPPFTTYLFDLDGTLLDSVALILASYRHTAMVHRGTAPDDDVWLAGLGTPLRTQLRQLSEDPAEIVAMVETYREHNLSHHDAMVRPYDGIVETVRAMAARAELGLVTSKLHHGALRGLRTAGLEDAFDVVVGADDVERHKPDPAPVLAALAGLDADPATAVFVGDSPHDMAAGRSAGIRTAAALWGPFPRAALEPHQPDFWLAAPRDLADL